VSAGSPARGQNAVSRLGRLIGLQPLPADVSEELGALRAEVSRLTQALTELQAAQAESQARLAGAGETLDRLEKQTTRAGKEQFKANAAAEAQQQAVKALLDQVRAAEDARDREVAALREALRQAPAEGRGEVLRALLPVVDGLDEALAAGQRLLAAAPAQPAAPAGQAPMMPEVSLAARLIAAWELVSSPAAPAASAPPPASPPARPADREALAAWLQGLGLVRARLLDLLAAEAIYPIAAEGEAFDPHQHVAVDTVPAEAGVAPGTIVDETRRGYRQGQAVLRYAEVIVAK
jgi:molecular chaperone GrpE (heat shock protein)